MLVSSCQNEQKISILEKELNILFDAKNNERDEKYKERFDSLLQVCLNDSNSFTYPFHDLKRSGKFNIMQSPDKKLRVYSYEDFGGTMKFYKSYIQYKRNGKIIVEQLGDSIYPFKGRYTSLYYRIEMGKNEYKLYGYWQISSNEIECDTIIINKMNYGK